MGATLTALGPYLATALLLALWWLALRVPRGRRRPRRASLPPERDVWSNYQREIVRQRSERRAS
ncbi:MAG: hypothetical protein DIU78_013080 [Pseudomonadota bacterium]